MYWVGVLVGFLGGLLLGIVLQLGGTGPAVLTCPDIDIPACVCPKCPSVNPEAFKSCMWHLSKAIEQNRSILEDKEDCYLNIVKVSAEADAWRNKYISYTCD